ncbi:MAG: N-acetylmuramoyl-L-alanine amidase [Acidimicrobiia bacterium]|nr:N-acetylmuramoyl-L-alanine amidase [Acidimicrobiia bacterium]
MSLRAAIAVVCFAVSVAACAGEMVTSQGAPRGVDNPAITASPTTAPAIATTTTTTTTTQPPTVSAGLAVVTEGGAPIFSEPGGTRDFVIHEGILLGFDSREGNFLEVVTTCNDTAWVRATDVNVIPKARRSVDSGQADLAKATIVVDPGHGSRDWGGVGPTGLTEKEVNLDVSRRLRDLLLTNHDVNWSTGAIQDGTTVPAVNAVFLTRDPDGAFDGDYELGLAYRSHIANSAGADVFVSIHHNTVPTADPDGPGSEIFYAWSVDDSDRLASLIHQELLLSLSGFDVDWKGGLIRGARARIDPETDTDYYGILRRANMPSVIVEGAYISEPEEEALLRTVEWRDAYAEAVYRGIVRFLTTPEFGEDVNEPEVFTSNAGTASTSSCVVPEQPGS